MANDIKEGSVVRLRSGGPAMTVSEIRDGFIERQPVARCHWINDDGAGKEYTFPLSTLVLN